MRLVHYYVINKETGKRVFTHCRRQKAEEFLQSLQDKDSYVIGYKWLSI